MQDNLTEIRKNNLLKIIKEQFNGKVNTFAKRVKRPGVVFYEVFNDKRGIGERLMRHVEAELGITPYELDQVDGAFKNLQFNLVNIYPTKLSIKKTSEIFSEETVGQSPIRATKMQEKGWEKELLCCFTIADNSMHPILSENSIVLINTATQEIINGRIYAIRIGNEVLIKRLHALPNENKVLVRSDNQLFPDLTIDQSKKSVDFKIIGMAVLKMEEDI